MADRAVRGISDTSRNYTEEELDAMYIESLDRTEAELRAKSALKTNTEMFLTADDEDALFIAAAESASRAYARKLEIKAQEDRKHAAKLRAHERFLRIEKEEARASFKPKAWMRLRAKNGRTLLMLRPAKPSAVKENKDGYRTSWTANRNVGWRELERRRDALKKKKEDLEESMRIIGRIKDAQMRRAVRHRKSLPIRSSASPPANSDKATEKPARKVILVPDSNKDVE